MFKSNPNANPVPKVAKSGFKSKSVLDLDLLATELDSDNLVCLKLELK